MLFSKSTSQLVTRRKLARLELKIESEEIFLNLSYFLQSNAALAAGCYYSRREPAQKEKACLRKASRGMNPLTLLYHKGDRE